MERSRESRRSSMSNGYPRRRHRAIALRDFSDEGAVVETSSKRRRNRDRDKDSSNRNKRRRGSHSYTTEEDSVGNEQDDDVQYAGLSLMRSTNTTSSTSDQNHRRSFTPAKLPPPPPLKVTDEMIGVAVPRKARSASVKRLHESCVSASGGGGGGGVELNFRPWSNSPGRDSVEPASLSSNVSARKMKAIGTVTKTSDSCSSDMDIEMAELLYGLMTSKNDELKDVDEKKVEDYNSSALVRNNSTSEIVRIQSEQTADLDCHDGNATGHEETPKVDIGDVTADARSVSPTRESPSCSKLDVDKQDSASARVMSAVPEANSQQVGKFDIDLMALPPMILSPEGDDLTRGDFTSKTKALALDVEMEREDSMKVEEKVERPVKKEKTLEEIKEAKMFDFTEKRDVPNHDLEKPNNDNDIKINDKLEEQDRSKEQPTKSSNPRVEKTAQSSSVHLSTAVSGWPNNISSIGYTPPMQTIVKTDKTTGSSTTLQHVNFVLSQPLPKRCATHHYIARNIFLHQQFTKVKPHFPAAVGSSSLCGTKPNKVNCVPSTESMVVGNQSSKHLQGVNQHGTQEKGWAAATSNPSLTAIRSSNNANPMDSTQRMQLVLHQGPHPGSTGNLVHGPSFIFPPGQHPASVAAATSQAGGVNSTNSASSYSKSHSSAAGSLGNSSTSPALAAAMSFSYPKFSASDTPYVTIVQNNGFSFPISTSLGATAAIRGAGPAQVTHILNGPFYSSQIFHPLQHPQQHPHSQALVQPSYLTASTSSSSSSRKQSPGAQVNGNNILTSTTMQVQQLQKQQTTLSHPRQHGTEMSGENATSVTNRTCYPQKNVHGHNYTVPVQPVNISFRPSVTSDIVGGNGQNFGDKQQQQALRGGVEVIPSQAFAMSFAAFNGTSIPSNLNFSSMAQNPVIFQSMPDIAWQGYEAASTSQSHTTQQMTYSITEGKSGGNSSQQDDEKKTTLGKSSTNGPTTLVFDNSSKNLNFVLSPMNGNWPSLTTASTAITSVPLSSNASSSQQPSQLLQLQKQHAMQQQQPAMATRYKASSTNTAATKFANDAPAFSQTVTQCKSSNQGSHSKSSGRTTDSHVHQASVITSNTPTLKSFSQEQGRVSQGHMQISFAGNCITSLPPQGQQLVNNKQPFCTTVAGTPLNGGNLKPNSNGRKVRQ